MVNSRKLANLKGQRTRLVKAIESEFTNAKTLLSEATTHSQTDTYEIEFENTKVFLENLVTKYEALTNKIAEETGSESEADEYFEEYGERSMELIVCATKLISRLEVASKGRRNGKSLSNTGRMDVESNEQGFDVVQDHLSKLLEIESLKLQQVTQVPDSHTLANRCHVRLPKLEFKKFSGDVICWTEFWDSFEASIHSNQTIQPVEKLSYLRSKLEDEPLRTIAGLQTTNDNYKVAIQLLKARYGNLQIMINAHYVKMMELTCIPNHTPKLRFLVDEIESHFRSLEALGEDINHRQFISMIMTKLPRPVVTKMEEMKDENVLWTVDLLRKKLHSHLVAREVAEYQFNDSEKSCDYERSDSKDTFHSKLATPRRSTTEALSVNHREDHSVPKRQACIFCSGSHWNDECHNFKTLEARKQLIRGRCFICLSDKHQMKNCPKPEKPCYHCKRTRHHHSSLCPVKLSKTTEPTAMVCDNTIQSDEPEHQRESEMLLAAGERVLLQTALCQIKGKTTNRVVKTRILLDCGSSRSYISQRLADQLRIDGVPEAISIVTFGAEKPRTVHTQSTDILLELKDGTNMDLAVNIVPKITSTISRSPVYFNSSNLLWKDLQMADSLPKQKEFAEIDCLIGSDYYMEMMTSEKIKIQDGLYLIGSKLGWIMTGRTSEHDDNHSTVSMFVSGSVNQVVPQLHRHDRIDPCVPINPSLEDFWSLEGIGIRDNLTSTDDERAQRMFNQTVTFADGRYQVTFPWKEEFPNLPNNFQLAFGRFKTNLRRLSKNKDLLQKYNEIIEDQVRKGVVERVCETNDDPGTRKHYIPHHPIITPMKTTTKVRIVYDASAKASISKLSLNECLLRGPVILQDLIGLLLRFRLVKVVILADIEKAFLQVSIQPQERDVTRFFWLEDANRPTTDNNTQIYRFCRVPFGIISSPFLLSATIMHHLKGNNTPCAEKIERSLYVDNIVGGVDSVKEACEFYRRAKHIFKEASMNLREWSSNSAEFLKHIPDHDRINQAYTKVLGLHWDVLKDIISIPGQTSDKLESASTKREVMQVMAMNFDPLGLFVPATLKTKLFVQSLWTQKMHWDDRLTDKQIEEWKHIAEDIKLLPSIKIPRRVPTEELKDPKLICFCDASSKAYAAAIYLQWCDGLTFRIQLLFAKTRLSPKKKLSLPRLELMAVLIGVRGIKFVESHLDFKIEDKVLWSDSQCTLYWLKSTKPLSVFVENRVKEIRRHDSITFKYVNTHDNPADVATRGENALKLSKNLLWWNGPSWISSDIKNWPSWNFEEISKTQLEAAQQETKRLKTFFEAGLSCVNEPCCIDQSKYSSLTRLLRVTAWILRFLRNAGAQFNQSRVLNGVKISSKGLTKGELSQAKAMWELFVQEEHFSDTIQAMKHGNKNDLQQRFGLITDGVGILRCRGRLENIDAPKLLPRKSHFTKLIVESIHKVLLHSGVSHTLSQLRNEYWIPQGRAEVRRVLSQCQVCRKHSGGPFRVPQMPPLPAFRTSQSSPFTYVGIDYFGPLWIKGTNDLQRKVWVCLFTCLCVRAIHLEIVESLSTEEFLMCLRRFIARKGTPTQVISDNAPQFKAANKMLKGLFKRMIEDTAITEFSSEKGIDWKFIVEFAPWMGGFYERLIGIVKNALKKSVGKLCLYSSQLQTMLSEVEAVVNSRPISYAGNDINTGSTLSPAHFLCLNPKSLIPNSDLTTDDDDDPNYNPRFNSTEFLIQSWNKGQKLLQIFWKCWHEEYLQALRERTETHLKAPKTTSKLFPTIGQIVLIRNALGHRGTWQLGSIQDVITSADGNVRAAKVKVSGKHQIICRSLQHLYPLECSLGDIPTVNDETHDHTIPGDDPANDEDPEVARDVRKAAVVSRMKTALMLKESNDESPVD